MGGMGMTHRYTSMKQKMIQEVYPVWDIEGVESARDLLKKMSLRDFNLLADIEEQRLLLHNLTTTELKTGKKEDLESARFHSKMLKELLENYPNYMDDQENRERYARALNNYVECYKENMAKEELVKIYEFCYNTYKDFNYDCPSGYLEKIIAKFNLNLTTSKFNMVFECFQDILIHKDDSQYKEALEGFKKDLKNTDELLYKQMLFIMKDKDIQII
jgi:tetratricopeptide (TPR) repeat protein